MPILRSTTPGPIPGIDNELSQPDELDATRPRPIRTARSKTAQVIAQLIELAKEMRAAHCRGEELGLTEEELAFYDALEVNDSAVKIMGDEVLRTIARELADAVRRNATIDWSVKESVKAKLRTLVKRLLRKHGYPPDMQEKATETILKQAEALCTQIAA